MNKVNFIVEEHCIAGKFKDSSWVMAECETIEEARKEASYFYHHSDPRDRKVNQFEIRTADDDELVEIFEEA